MIWALRDAWTLNLRVLAHWRRSPGPPLTTLLFPVLVVLMFGSLFGGQMQVPGGDYYEVLVPGMLALAMLFGVEATMTAVAVDASRGITDRLRSMPLAPGAVLAGRAVADMLLSAAGLAVLAAAGLLLGWGIHDGAGPALLAFALLLSLRFAFVWIGFYLGLVARDPQAVVAVQILVWPVGFLSSAFVDPGTMPAVLGTLAEWNPLSATVAATRELCGNPALGSPDHAVALAVAWPVALTAVFAPLAIRRFRRLGG